MGALGGNTRGDLDDFRGSPPSLLGGSGDSALARIIQARSASERESGTRPLAETKIQIAKRSGPCRLVRPVNKSPDRGDKTCAPASEAGRGRDLRASPSSLTRLWHLPHKAAGGRSRWCITRRKRRASTAYGGRTFSSGTASPIGEEKTGVITGRAWVRPRLHVLREDTRPLVRLRFGPPSALSADNATELPRRRPRGSNTA